jgi:hypothetical protein
MKSNNRADAMGRPLLLRMCALVLGTIALQAQAAGASMSAGQRVTYRDNGGTAWCATITAVEAGVDASSWAWLTIDADRRRVVKVEVVDLVDGCKPPARTLQ